MYIVVCTSCLDCGSQAVGLFAVKPSDMEIYEMRRSIGGMYCIQDKVYEVEAGEFATEPVDTEE